MVHLDGAKFINDNMEIPKVEPSNTTPAAKALPSTPHHGNLKRVIIFIIVGIVILAALIGGVVGGIEKIPQSSSQTLVSLSGLSLTTSGNENGAQIAASVMKTTVVQTSTVGGATTAGVNTQLAPTGVAAIN